MDASDYDVYDEKLQLVDEPFLVGLPGSAEGSDSCKDMDGPVCVSVAEVRRSFYRDEVELEEIA